MAALIAGTTWHPEPCDAAMNSARAGADPYKGRREVSYTSHLMTQYQQTHDRAARFQQVMSLLGQARAVMSEVRACAISKLSGPGVAPT